MLVAVFLWAAGLVTLVPFCTWYLFYRADREHYALLITAVLFWVFGYWGVAGPILLAQKARAVFRAIEVARSHDDLVAALRSPQTRDVAIDLIASENRVPRFVAAWLYRKIAERLPDLAAKGEERSRERD